MLPVTSRKLTHYLTGKVGFGSLILLDFLKIAPRFQVNQELEVLRDLYGKGDNPDVNINALKVEWEGFKFLMSDNYH